MSGPKVDYRATITKRDILTIRRALREAIYLYSQPGTPAMAAKQKEEFGALLKKLKGVSFQRAFCLKATK